MIQVKRAYEPPARGDGQRVLVERLWPRGVKKEALALDDWLKDVAPSTELRQWYGHVPARWPAFERRYRAELDANPEAWKPLLRAAREGTLTLVYGARDEEHNSAVALRAYLEAHGAGGRKAAPGRAKPAGTRAAAAKRKQPGSRARTTRRPKTKKR